MADGISSKVLQRLSRRDAFSESRRSYLEKFANLIVTAEVDVAFGNLPNPARCMEQDNGEFLVEIDHTTIEELVSHQQKGKSDVLDGPLSQASYGYADAFIQEGLLYHELGHVLFSDFDALGEVLGRVPMSERQAAQQLVNAFEDAVIELFLQQYFDCRPQLLVKNRVYHNVYHAEQPLWTMPETADPVTQATLPAFELGRYESGVLDEERVRSIDAVARGIEAFYDVIQLPDAEERYEYLVDLYQDLSPDSNPSDAEQQMDQVMDGEAGHEGRQDGQQQSPSPIEIDPEGDESEEDEEDGSGAGSGDEDEDEESDEGVGGGSESDDEADEDESPGAGGKPGEGDDEDDVDDDDSSPSSLAGGLDEADVEELQSETELDPSDGSDDTADQIETELKAGGLGAGQGSGDIVQRDPDQYTADEALISNAERRSHHLSRVVEQHFTPSKGKAEETGLTSGMFDQNEMIKASRGSPRCFKREENPDKPEFQVVLAIDESGSMGSNDRIRNAASAATTIVKAFEDAGGEVYVYRFSRDVSLVKTPSMGYDRTKEAVAAEDVGGGTDLFPLLEQYEELTRGVRNSFLFVISDGKPGRIESCRDQMSRIDDPKACLQIGEDAYNEFPQEFDAYQVLPDDAGSEIQTKAESIVRRLVETRGSAL